MAIKHLIDIDQLSLSDIKHLFELAHEYLAHPFNQELHNKTLINLFFENSTRTRSSFEIAARNMGARVVNIDISQSSLKKGESCQDTILTLNAYQTDFITIRHNHSGMVEKLSRYSDATIINSGDGSYAHPTQALLDCFTIFEHFKLNDLQNFAQLKIAICGDIINSRVARSNIKLLTKLGSKINLVAPATLLPRFLKQDNITKYHDLSKAVSDVNVIYTLRLQKERMNNCSVPSMKEYFKFYGITHNILKYAKDDAIIMHPGPINRNIEISSQIADDDNICKILNQVRNGVAMRQAVLKFLS